MEAKNNIINLDSNMTSERSLFWQGMNPGLVGIRHDREQFA